jgi:hypothetical protein
MRNSYFSKLRLSLQVLGLAGVLGCGAPFAQDGALLRGERVVAISDALCSDMKLRHVLNPGAPVGCERLRLVSFHYFGFDGRLHDDGEMVVMDAAADHVLQIFVTLRGRHFPIASAKLMNEYDGDDDASMDHNNTSSLNVRPVAGGNSISVHAYGLAIDLDPVQNPFLQRTGAKFSVSPKAGVAYVSRKSPRPGMSESVVDVFAHHGFTVWGGEWKNPIDYQHFQVSRRLADQLARLPAPDAKGLFDRHVARYRDCLRATRDNEASARRSCAKGDGTP